jgi:hypothetical protein
MSIGSPEPDVEGSLIEAGDLNEVVARSLGETIQPTDAHGRQSPKSGYSLRHPALNCAPTRSLWREPNTLAAKRLPAAVPDSKPYSDDASVEAAALPRRDLLVQARSERQSGAEESDAKSRTRIQGTFFCKHTCKIHLYIFK